MAFFKGSRYAGLKTLVHTDAAGRPAPYKAMRLITTPRAVQGHRVQQGERLDHVADRYFSDPERFWRICDANTALWPDDVVAEPGAVIAIPTSEE